MRHYTLAILLSVFTLVMTTIMSHSVLAASPRTDLTYKVLLAVSMRLKLRCQLRAHRIIISYLLSQRHGAFLGSLRHGLARLKVMAGLKMG